MFSSITLNARIPLRKYGSPNGQALKSTTLQPRTQIRSFRWSKLIKNMDKKTLNEMKRQQANRATSNQNRASTMTVKTLGRVMDPWLPPSLFRSPLQMKYWSDLYAWGKHIIAGTVGSWYQQRQIINTLPPNSGVKSITRREAKEQAEALYVHFHKDIINLNLKNIESYVSDSVLKEVFDKYGRRKLPPHLVGEWVPFRLNTKILNFVCVQVPPPMNKTYVQVTVKFTNHQSMKLKNKETGEVVSGDDQLVEVTDIWVVERLLEDPKAPWYIVKTKLE